MEQTHSEPPKKISLLPWCERRCSLNHNKRYYLKGSYAGIYLTQREYETLISLLQGNTVKGISMIKNISPRTVEDYVKSLKIKLGFSHKSDMLRRLIEINYLVALKQIVPTES